MLPNYSLRPVLPTDWEFWRTLHHSAERATIVHQFGPWDEALQDKFARITFDDTDGERAVIVVNGADVGWWQLKPRHEELFLNQIVLAIPFQGRGIGRDMLEKLIACGRAENKDITLQTLLQNTAKGLYEKLGFVVEGQTETNWQMRLKVNEKA